MVAGEPVKIAATAMKNERACNVGYLIMGISFVRAPLPFSMEVAHIRMSFILFLERCHPGIPVTPVRLQTLPVDSFELDPVKVYGGLTGVVN